MLLLTADEKFGIHVAGIDDLFLRLEVALSQFLLNGGGHLHIWDGGNRGLDLHNEMGDGLCLLLLALLQRTRLGEVNFVPEPGRFALFACLGFWVRGGTNAPLVFTGLRTCPPFGLPTPEVIRLLPDLLQEWHTRHLLEFGWD